MSESRRIRNVQNPIIPDVAALIKTTPGTISLGQGVVHYGPPPEVFEAVARLDGDAANHIYHHATGLPQLREGLHAKLATDNNIAVGDNQTIMVTAGSNMGFYHSVLAIADPGDEIILLTPYFFNHEMAVEMADCRAKLVPTDAGYQPQLDRIEAAITPSTRAVVTVSPNNPAGAVYSREDLIAINCMCRDRGIYHISDEAYEYFTYDGAEHYSPASAADASAHTISLFSFSKSYGMASWRVGYLVAPTNLLGALQKIQDTILICPPAISQVGATGALEAGSSFCRDNIARIASVRQVCLDHLDNVEDVATVTSTTGAFYLLIRLKTDLTSMHMVERLIRNYQIAVIPGIAFGLEECYIRIAYGALVEETAAAGMERLVAGLHGLIRSGGA